MVLRSNKSQRAYRKHRRRNNKPACDFCVLSKQQILFETESVAVICNLFPYAMWDFAKVREHLMVVPKSHVESIAELPKHHQAEYFQVVADYEARGYNFYGRGPSTISKSIAHQHTHLIQVEPAFLRLWEMVWAFVGDDIRSIAIKPKSAAAALANRLTRALLSNF